MKSILYLPNQLPNSRTAWLAFAVTIRDNAPFIRRRDLQIFLEKRNIQTRTVFHWKYYCVSQDLKIVLTKPVQMVMLNQTR
jgi:hypothetical protein